MIFGGKEKSEKGVNEETLSPSEAFTFNYVASPVIAEQLGLDKGDSLTLSPHPEPLLDSRVFLGVEEFEVTAHFSDDSGQPIEAKKKGVRVFHAYNYWLITKGDFIYIEPRDGANFSGIKKLAQVQAKLASMKVEGATSSKHWVLVNFAGLPGPSPKEIIAGIISAATDALRGAKSEIAIQGFCETVAGYLFSNDTINKEKRDTVFNLIRMGSQMDQFFVSPAEIGTTEPGAVIEYLRLKMKAIIDNRGHLSAKK
jgi:hypothetical protein